MATISLISIGAPRDVDIMIEVLSVDENLSTFTFKNRTNHEFTVSIPKNNTWENVDIIVGMQCFVQFQDYGNELRRYTRLNLKGMCTPLN